MAITYLSVASTEVIYRGFQIKCTPIVPLLESIDVAELWWNGTKGFYIDMDGETHKITNTDKFSDILWLVEYWCDNDKEGSALVPVQYVRSGEDHKMYFIVANKAAVNQLGVIKTIIRSNRPDEVALLSSGSIDVPDDLIAQVYIKSEDKAYKFLPDGTKEEVVWEQGKEMVSLLDTDGQHVIHRDN